LPADQYDDPDFVEAAWSASPGDAERHALLNAEVRRQTRAARVLADLLIQGHEAGLASIDWKLSVHQPGRIIGTVNPHRDGSDQQCEALAGWSRIAGATKLHETPTDLRDVVPFDDVEQNREEYRDHVTVTTVAHHANGLVEVLLVAMLPRYMVREWLLLPV
jgi:hypothetical protein